MNEAISQLIKLINHKNAAYANLFKKEMELINDAKMKGLAPFIQVYEQFLTATSKVLLCTGNYIDNPDDHISLIYNLFQSHFNKNNIVIYVDLKETHHMSNSFINAWLLTKYQLNDEQINFFKACDNVLFIFDHYGANGEFVNLYVTQRLSEWKAKSLILCDLRYLTKFKNYLPCFVPYINGKKQSHLLLEYKLVINEQNNISQTTDSHRVSTKAYINILKKNIEKLPSEKKLPIESQIFSTLSHSNQNYIVQLLSHPLAQISLTQDATLISLLADKVKVDKSLKSFLFQFIFASRSDVRLSIGAANAITALCVAGESFANLDLSFIKIPGANLSGGNFYRTKFINADLTSVSFRQACLIKTDFTGACLKDIRLGQFAKVKLGSSVISPIAPHNNSFITAKVEDKSPDCKVTIIDIITDFVINEIVLFQFEVESFYLSPDGYYILIYGCGENDEKNTYILFTIHNLKEINRWNDGDEFLNFSPDRKYLVFEQSVHSLSICYIYPPFQSKNIVASRNRGIGGGFQFSTISSDARYFAYAAEEGILIFDLSDDIQDSILLSKDIYTQCLMRNDNEYDDDIDNFAPHSIVFKPDANILASGHDRDILIWDFRNKRVIAHLKGHSHFVYTLAFNKEGTLLASGSDDNTIRLWDTDHWKPLQILAEMDDRIIKVLFHPTEPYLAASDEHDCTYFDFSQRINAPKKVGHTHVIESIAVNKDKNIYASCGWGHEICLWHADNFRLLEKLNFPFSGQLKKIIFQKNSNTLLIATEYPHTVSTYNLDTAQFKLLDIPSKNHKSEGITFIEINTIGTLIAFCDAYHIIIYDAITGKQLTEWFEEREEDDEEEAKSNTTNIKKSNESSDVTKAVFSPDNKYLVVGYKNGRVCFTEIKSLLEFWLDAEKLPFKNKESRIKELYFTPQGKLIVANDDDELVIVGKQKIFLPTRKARVCAFLSLDARTILIGDVEGHIFAYDLIEHKQLFAIKAHQNTINSLCLLKPNVLASGSADYVLSIWEIQQSDNQFNLIYIRSSRPLLNAFECNIHGVKEMDNAVSKLLIQMGSVDKTSEFDRTHFLRARP